MMIVHLVLGVCALIVVARLIELQVIKGKDYLDLAQAQHFGGVKLPAKRGEVLSRNARTGETSILATNATLDLVYIDPVITDNPTLIAEALVDTLVTEEIHAACVGGLPECPRELFTFYGAVFDPLERVRRLNTGALLEPIPDRLSLPVPAEIPEITEVRRQFARAIENRIREKRVTFVPLLYGATKVQMQQVEELSIPGVTVVFDAKLIYANPEEVAQLQIPALARRLAGPMELDEEALRGYLRSRPLRYVPIMRRLTPEISEKLRERQLQSLEETRVRRREAPTREAAQQIQDPLRCIALLPEHWRFYPDGTVASHVVGFLNAVGEAQYGIERTYNPLLRGQEGLIATVSDPQGGQILTADQRIVDPKDGSTIILTIDRFIQEKVEELLQDAVARFDAESAQAIVMDPYTGRILAMANAPLFDSNNYGDVYERDPLILDEGKRKGIIVELYHPESRGFVVRSFIDDLFTPEGRATLSEETRKKIDELESLYDLKDIVRYYLLIGEHHRREIFPTERSDVWLKYKNNVGVGAYLNRNIQEIYEPGSVMKPITMAVAIDQGEVTPGDIYDDGGPIKVDEYTIKNALNRYYGKVTMTNCLEFSVNTCMTSVSEKLGRKLFHRSLERFGFGRVSGIELEDELPGEILPWRKWSNALLATAAYGQGISATPLQMITGYTALANGGKLMRPTIIDSIIHSDGTIEKYSPRMVDQVITAETSDTITAMLVSSINLGYAKVAKVKGYRMAGKTGTSQIAGPGGKYEAGTGSTIATFAGYAPVPNPKFLILVKFDRPRKDIYGSQTAGPVFRDIAAFLFKYYGIPPNEQ
ncbi:MAG: cell division protein FtsI (penicillin-binding protein 3) [Candidatus Peregrinibacteria bacterium Greene1014_49]|nr:MAG: cell division protein FtsI (penicillin-binding protein 3) [Candidatus Peregrinibacteria bacterium Greene1014_49]